MNNSAKTFILFFVLSIVAVFLFYRGIEEEYAKRRLPVSSPIPEVSTSPHVLGDEIVNSSESAMPDQNSYPVTKVVDGDTFEVSIDNKLFRVRMIGVDTPETVDPNRPKGCYGNEASNKTKELLTGKRVVLEKDVSETDRYNRLLRYVYLPLENGQTLFVNDYLVREGYAQVLTYPPDVAFNEQFLEAQRAAQSNKKGLWGICNR